MRVAAPCTPLTHLTRFAQSPDNYSAATVPQYQLATLQALAEGKQVAGVAEDAKAKATRWQRVSKVLDGERKKILAKNASATPAPAAQA